MRTKQLSPRTENRLLAALEHREYGSIDCDRLGVRSRVNDYDFRRITDPNSIVVEIHEPCRSVRDLASLSFWPTWRMLACRLAMRIKEQSPKGVKGLRTLLVEIEQLHPCSTNRFASATSGAPLLRAPSQPHRRAYISP